jgi:hypothetical protein
MYDGRRFRSVVSDIEAPGVPRVGQAAFQRMLKRSCGCELVWHRYRRCFIVCRDRGRAVTPVCYTDLGPNCWPLGRAILPHVLNLVHWTDAHRAMDLGRMMRVAMKAIEDTSREDTRRFVDERFPDFIDALEWATGRAEHGREWGRKTFDLGAKDGAA